MNNPSLLDWIKSKLSGLHFQRWLRLGLAVVAGLWGALALVGTGGRDAALGYFLLGLAVGLFLWGLLTKEAAVPRPALPELTLSLAPPAVPQVAAGLNFPGLIQDLLLPGSFLLAAVGQLILTYNRDEYIWGLGLYVLALLAFGRVVWQKKLLGAARVESAPAEALLQIRWPLVGVALAAGVFAFVASGGNQFTPEGVLAWAVCLVSWLLAVWQTDFSTLWPRLRERVRSLAQAEKFHVSLSSSLLALVLILGVGAYFRYARLDSIPPEMTSDHVEKLLDVNDVLQGADHVYFERNTGREPLQFYLAVLTLNLLGTGLTFLTLKIGTATAGFLMLPFVYLLGREVEDEQLGLLATLLAAISFWATTISRVGLRFPLSPLFAAPVLYFLVRGLRRSTRNDFLLAGLFLGMGLNGYSPFRVVPLAVIVAVAWFALWPHARGRRLGLWVNTGLLAVTAFILFIPLFRYALQPENLFWYRTGSRLSGEYSNSAPDTWLASLGVFLHNQWSALQMFNGLGDSVWVNTIPGRPALDLISGGLLILGVGFILSRLVLRRDWLAGLWLILIPILMLPSTLSLAFPEENPSVVRVSGVMPVIFILAAYPLWLLVKQWQAKWPGVRGKWAAVVAAAVVAAAAGAMNHQAYFVDYSAQYLLSAQNASEIGVVIHDFARTMGSYETVFVRPYPYWVDTRAVGMYAQGGNPTRDFGREFAIEFADLASLTGEARPKLIIMNRLDTQSRPDGVPPTLPELRRLFPTGTLSLYHSKRDGHDFLMFFVPGTQDLDASQLPTQ
jgi:hypothetical protein